MRIIKAVAVLATILWVSAIGWEQATQRVETNDGIVANIDDPDPTATLRYDCVAIDFDAIDETADPLLLPN